ncbi:MAG TPA: MFS transporter [Bacillota bacterium]|nr:MFS transporter [Bacillota bacterium]
MAGPGSRALQRVVVDTSALRGSRDFRLLFLGQGISQIGSQLRIVALPYQIFLITHSSAMVGVLSLAQFIPLLIFSLVGGALADFRDRRRILFYTQALLAVTSALLAVGTYTGHASVVFLFAVAAAAAGVSAFDQPTRRAAIPRMVRREDLMSAFALNQVLAQFGNVLGPAIGGVVIAALGLPAAYAADVIGFMASLATLIFIAPIPPDPAMAAAAGSRQGVMTDLRRSLTSIAEGLRFLKDRKVILGCMLLDLDATFFGGPRALFPALATLVYRNGAAGLGLLYSAPAVGGLLAALTSGWVTGLRRQGATVAGAVVVWGLAIAAFGFAEKNFVLGLGLLALAGAADMISAVLRGTIVQMAAPDRMRGRMSGVHFMFVTGGPRLGDLEAGVVASLSSIEFSVVSGGIAAAIGAVALAFALPAFIGYDAAAAQEEVPA